MCDRCTRPRPGDWILPLLVLIIGSVILGPPTISAFVAALGK
jgi:hypothetical protein